jgi:hypothetical protein
MLRDFGLVTVADLGVALIGVMLVLPAALVWAEEGFAGLSWRRPGPATSESASEPPVELPAEAAREWSLR